MKNDMKRILILITTSFPYGKLEPFIESELNYYKNFDKVLCLAIHRNGELRKIDYPSNFSYKSINDYKFSRDIKYIFKYLFKKSFWSELHTLLITNRLSLTNLRYLISVTIQAEHYYKAIKKEIKEIEKSSNKKNKYYFYSYWMVEHALCCIKLKRRLIHSINFTRAHGYDLYEYRYKGNYIPYRKYILKESNLVIPISNDGFEYLKDRYGEFNNIEISRLGTIDYGISNKIESDYDLTVVSCAWCSKVKRIDRIITSLSSIKNHKIKWYHIGDGDLFNRLKDLAEEKLPENIHYEFLGQLPNQKILEFYKNNRIDLFINTSASEGIPVSIMEVQSFGIPVIATDVGGVKEIITHNRNGYLINKEFKDEELTSLIESFARMSKKEIDTLREVSRTMWENKYSAKENYTKLFNKIIKM